MAGRCSTTLVPMLLSLACLFASIIMTYFTSCLRLTVVLDALGQMSAFTPSNVYLVDSQPGRSASAVAINNCFRSIAGAITAIFSTQALHGGGPGILYTILAAINVANIGFVVMCMIYGQQWRQAVAKKRGIATPDADTSMEKKATAATTDKDDDPELGDKDSSLHQQQQQHQEIEHTLARTASRHSAL